MSVEENKALILRLYDEVFGRWDLAVVDELIAPEFVAHEMPPGTPKGPEGFREYYRWLRSSFPDLRYTADDIIAEGDRVAVRSTWTGTHTGHFMGIAPSGKHTTVQGIAVYRVAGGRCIERWVEFDMTSLLKQLGEMPAVADRR